MRPPCTIVVEEALPEIRKRMAKHLYSCGSSQEDIGKLLGVSQAMVSRYLKEEIMATGSLDRFIDGMVRPLCALAETGANEEQLTDMFCTNCSRMILSGHLDHRYSMRYPGVKIPKCASRQGLEDRARIIEELSMAQRYLEKQKVWDLVPAVKINMAQCTSEPLSREDVASFPGRLLEESGSVRQTLPPMFGSSRHLAELLMEAHKADRNVNSVINLRYSRMIGSALERMGVGMSYLGRDNGRIVNGIGPMINDGFRAIADPGDFGIEPCLYLFGASPLEVASIAVDIQKHLDGSEVI